MPLLLRFLSTNNFVPIILENHLLDCHYTQLHMLLGGARVTQEAELLVCCSKRGIARGTTGALSSDTSQHLQLRVQLGTSSPASPPGQLGGLKTKGSSCVSFQLEQVPHLAGRWWEPPSREGGQDDSFGDGCVLYLMV